MAPCACQNPARKAAIEARRQKQAAMRQERKAQLQKIAEANGRKKANA